MKIYFRMRTIVKVDITIVQFIKIKANVFIIIWFITISTFVIPAAKLQYQSSSISAEFKTDTHKIIESPKNALQNFSKKKKPFCCGMFGCILKFEEYFGGSIRLDQVDQAGRSTKVLFKKTILQFNTQIEFFWCITILT